jgi:hypothetical protein
LNVVELFFDGELIEARRWILYFACHIPGTKYSARPLDTSRVSKACGSSRTYGFRLFVGGIPLCFHCRPSRLGAGVSRQSIHVKAGER